MILQGLPLSTLLLVFGVAALILLALYLLKTRVEKVEVPHLRLWQRVYEAEQSRAWWERWKRWFSLLLALLIAAMIVAAVGDPTDPDELERGGSLVIVLDQTSSMQALDAGENQTRFEAAVDYALEELEERSSRDEVALIVADPDATVRVPFTRDHSLVRESLIQLVAYDVSGDAEAAAKLATRLSADRAEREILVLTDAVSGTDQDETTELAELSWVSFGADTSNLAVTGFRLRRYPLAPTDFEALVAVTNASPNMQPVRLVIHSDGEVVATFRERLPAGRTSTFIYDDLPAAGIRWRATVEPLDEGFVDGLSADDSGYAVLADRENIRLLLVTDGNLYLEAPLLLNEAVRPETMTWTEYRASPADDLGEYDAFILDGGDPGDRRTERGDYLYFDGPPGADADTDGGERIVEDPIIDQVDGTHPLMRAIGALRDVNIARARQIDLADDDVVVARAVRGSPMIVARVLPAGAEVHVAFHVAESDLPLRVAFPMFLANVVDWFRTSRSLDATSYSVDEIAALETPGEAERWEIARLGHDGEPADTTGPALQEFLASDGSVTFRPTRTGIYRLSSDDNRTFFAITSTSEEEANIAISEPDPPSVTTTEQAGRSSRVEIKDIWVWLLLAASGLLTLEWFTWSRRWTV